MQLTHKNKRILTWMSKLHDCATAQEVGNALSGKSNGSKAWAWAYPSIRELKMMELIEEGPQYVCPTGRALKTYRLTAKGLIAVHPEEEHAASH